MDIEKRVEDAAAQGIQLVTAGLQAILCSSKEKGREIHSDEASYICTASIGGGLQLMAAIVGRCPKCGTDEKHSPTEHINSVSVLFSAILAAEACGRATVLDRKMDRGTAAAMTMEFGPNVILSALEKVEKLTGENPDQYLNRDMVKAVREIEKEGAEQSDKLLADLLTKHGEDKKPLN